MTIYTIKVNRHETVKTTELHEAIKIAKKALIDKIAARGLHPVSVSEKMYLDRGNGKAAYRVFATVWEKRMCGSRAVTFSNSVRMENIPCGGYNFALHKELTNAFDERRKENENH